MTCQKEWRQGTYKLNRVPCKEMKGAANTNRIYGQWYHRFPSDPFAKPSPSRWGAVRRSNQRGLFTPQDSVGHTMILDESKL